MVILPKTQVFLKLVNQWWIQHCSFVNNIELNAKRGSNFAFKNVELLNLTWNDIDVYDKVS